MAEVLFEPRYALEAVRNPDMSWLQDVILDPFRPGWEFGEAMITFREDGRNVTLILIADRKLGYYLMYEPGTGRDTWLSLGDARRLTKVVCPDDWHVSAGLFVPPEKAWLAIHEFCRSGAVGGDTLD